MIMLWLCKIRKPKFKDSTKVRFTETIKFGYNYSTIATKLLVPARKPFLNKNKSVLTPILKAALTVHVVIFFFLVETVHVFMTIHVLHSAKAHHLLHSPYYRHLINHIYSNLILLDDDTVKLCSTQELNSINL